MALQVAAMLGQLTAAGSLRMLAGRTEEMTAVEEAVRVPILARGSGERTVIEAGRIINCSGPEHDFEKLSNRLVRSLLAQGQIAPYPLGIGLQVAPHGAMIARDGTIATRLFAIGPVRYGTLIETTAIPEIRIQAQELAEFFARTPCDLRK
jgi:uncharacterized NAD(P)/FAD-binding protein YdhS